VKKSYEKIHFYNFGKFRLDATNRELLSDGKHVPLTQKSFELLEFLIQNRGRGLRKNEILNDIWTESFVEEANLAQHIYMVRKALKYNGDAEDYIETIPKFGYRFVGEVEEEFVDYPLALIKPPGENEQKPSTNGSHSLETVSTLGSASEHATFEPAASQPDSTSDKATPFPASSKRIGYFASIGIAFVIVLATLGLVYFTFFRNVSNDAKSRAIKSIAILPFSQIGNDTDEKLGLGIADTLISKLGNQSEISISPTSTIIKFIEKGTDNPIEIGEQLGVDAVLTGTIQREADTVRVNVQLISVSEKTPRWSEKFDAKFSNIFALQDRVSEQVAKSLALKLNEPTQITEANRYTENIEAYQAYTMGLFYWDKREEDSLPKAVENFEKAIAKDPKFATAYAHAADAYSLIGYYKFSGFPEEEAIEKAKELANKALELDPKSSEAFTALGIVALYEKNGGKALELYRKAVQLKPNNATARQRLAWMLTTNKTLDEAISEMRLAQKSDPISVNTNLNLTRLLRLNRQPDEALIFCNRALEMDPESDSANVFLAEIYEQNGEYEKAIRKLEEVIEKYPEELSSKLILSRIYAKKGEKKKARYLLEESLKDKDLGYYLYELATAYLFLGERTKAIETLKNAKEHTLIYYLHIKYDPNLDPIRKSSEYTEILKTAYSSLDPAYK